MNPQTNKVARLACACLGVAAVMRGVVAQSPLGGGPLTEDDGAYIYRHAPDPLAFDYDVRSTLEIGDDLAFSGMNRVLTELTFSYKADYSRPQGAVVTLYTEGGPDAYGLFMPQTKIFERAVDVQAGGGIGRLELAYNLANTLPDKVIFTVRFIDVPTGSQPALVAEDGDPTVGQTQPGYWERTGSGEKDWALRPLNGTSANSANFLVTVKAAPIPEPGTVALGVAGLASLAWASRRRTRSTPPSASSVA